MLLCFVDFKEEYLDLLSQWVQPLCLEALASIAVKGRIVAWRADRNRSDKFAIDGRVESTPSILGRPASIAWQAQTLLSTGRSRFAFTVAKKSRPNEPCN